LPYMVAALAESNCQASTAEFTLDEFMLVTKIRFVSCTKAGFGVESCRRVESATESVKLPPRKILCKAIKIVIHKKYEIGGVKILQGGVNTNCLRSAPSQGKLPHFSQNYHFEIRY
jgi:hypothetical protein